MSASSSKVTTITLSNKDLKERLLYLITSDKIDVTMTLNVDECYFFLKYGDKDTVRYSVGDWIPKDLQFEVLGITPPDKYRECERKDTSDGIEFTFYG